MKQSKEKVMKTPHKRLAINLAREEWDFGSCPKDQLCFCDVYEHARENPLVLEAVQHLRSSGDWRPDPRLPLPWSRYAAVVIELFSLFPEFPGTPFLLINPILRKERCDRLNELRMRLAIQLQ